MDEIAGKLPEKGEFSSQINSIFSARGGEGADFDLSLVKLDDISSSDVHENYSLLFRAPTEAPAAQGMYRLEHAELGEMDLFLVPVKKDAAGLYYEAVFNNFIAQ